MMDTMSLLGSEKTTQIWSLSTKKSTHFFDGSVTLKGKPIGIHVSQPCMGALRPEVLPESARPAVRPDETHT